MATELSQEKKQMCQEVFNFFDKDLDGSLKRNDIGDAIKALGLSLSAEELKDLLSNNPEVNYSSFEVIAGKKLSEKVNKNILISSFAFLDKNNSGMVTEKEFMQALTTLGDPISSEDAANLIKPHLTGDKKIPYKNVINSIVGR